MNGKILVFSVLLACIIPGAGLRADETNRELCQTWCATNDVCEKCSKVPTCGVSFSRLKAFTGIGENWFACKRTTSPSSDDSDDQNTNQTACESWCASSLECLKCSMDSTCGNGFVSFKGFEAEGQNWYACKSAPRADGRKLCEAWCAGNSECSKCSAVCGSGFRRLKMFKGVGKIWSACTPSSNSFSKKVVVSQRRCETWCKSTKRCTMCTKALKCEAGFKQIRSFSGNGMTWRACLKVK